LYNEAWFESLDIANRVVNLNGHQMHVDDDGKWRVVVAHYDPGVPNWLDTEGRRSGCSATGGSFRLRRPRRPQTSFDCPISTARASRKPIVANRSFDAVRPSLAAYAPEPGDCTFSMDRDVIPENDDYYMRLAFAVAARSNRIRRVVGVVVVVDDRVLST
ncbi:MAG: hypothetical protein ACRDWD_06650, partial [Acidimicrobiia bacterium]